MAALAKFNPTLAELAGLYQVSRQMVHYFVGKHGFEIVSDPDLLFERLLEGPSCGTRSLLSNPIARGSIREAIESFRQARNTLTA